MDSIRLCAATTDLRRHLAGLEQQDRFTEAVDARTNTLLQTSHHPFKAEHLAEALMEMSAANVETLAMLLQAGNEAGAGIALKVFVTEYWESVAQFAAHQQIERESSWTPLED